MGKLTRTQEETVTLPDLTSMDREDVIALRDHAAAELLRRARLESAHVQVAEILAQVRQDGGDADTVIQRGRDLMDPPDTPEGTGV